MIKKLITAAVGLASLAMATSASANLIIAIDQTGGNLPVSIDTPRTWNFGVTAAGAAYFTANGFTFDTALFDAKLHQDTTAPLVFSLYSGLGGNLAGNTLLRSLSVPALEFNQQYGGGAGSLFSYTPALFTMGYYSVTLTSAAPDRATQDYFLKQGKLTLETANGTPLNSAYWVQDQGTGNATGTFNGSGNLEGGGGSGGGIVLAPEPGTWVGMAALTVCTFGGSVLRRLRKQVPA